MYQEGIVDDVIKSKCHKDSICCLCSKKGIRPYVVPEKSIIETVYTATGSLEIFKMVKAFRFCDEHYELFKEYQENNCDSLEMDRVIEESYDSLFLGRLEKLFDDVNRIMIGMGKYISAYRRSVEQSGE